METGRPSSLRVISALALALAGASCGAEGSRAGGASLGQAVVYGTDDRKEAFAGDEPAWLTEATSTRLLALGDREEITLSDAGKVSVDAPTLQQRFDLCEGEAFAAQPSFATCSAVIVSSRYVLTAAHCTRALSLDQQVGLSRFYNESSGALHSLGPDELHTFTKVVTHDDYWDYAWLELTEPISGLVTASVGFVANGDAIASIHHGAGLPAKVTRSTAASVDEASFLSTLDAFGGASGGPIFSEAGELLGILTSGAPDYQMSASGCLVTARRVDTPDAAAELAVRLDFALEGLCTVANDPELCPALAPPAGERGCAIAHGPARSRTSAASILAALFMLLSLLRRNSELRGADRMKGRPAPW